MHDPMTVAFDIKWPWFWMKDQPTLATIWHVDPERDGTDDSCGWFMRARHGDEAVLKKIISRFEHEWDRTFTSDSKRTYFCGLFAPNGEPYLSPHAITLNLFFWAAGIVFESDGHTNWRKARRWMNEHLFDILHFAENPTDSLHDGIVRKYETACGEKYTPKAREDRIRNMAACIYAWILREQRPWWRHPRWHVHHWKVQIHAVEHFKRWALSSKRKAKHEQRTN